jgi:hypothetical protein
LQEIQWGNAAQLQGAYLAGAELQGADLHQAQLQGAVLEWAKLQGTDFHQAQLQGAVLEWTQLQGANLRQAQLQGAILRQAQLQGTVLEWAQLQGEVLQHTQLQGADLQHTQLQGADLWGAQVGSADFSDATFVLNDFRQMDTAKPYSKDDFEHWQTNIRPLIRDQETADEQARRLKASIGQTTHWPMQHMTAPCLAEQAQPPFQNCQVEPNAEYFNPLAQQLGDLACQAGAIKTRQDVIAPSIAYRISDNIVLRRLFFNRPENDWQTPEATAARQALAHRLLQADCAGHAGLDDYYKAKLQKLANPPKP